MSTKPISEITEQLINQMLETKNNEEFIEKINEYLKDIK